MSSGRIAKNLYTDFNGNIQLNNYQILETADKYHINFSIERNYINQANIISNFIKFPLDLKIPNINNNSLLKAIEIHNFLINNENLTNNQKLDYCQIGRHFMKIFLKEIVKKYENL